jgi:hypothetical protein
MNVREKSQDGQSSGTGSDSGNIAGPAGHPALRVSLGIGREKCKETSRLRQSAFVHNLSVFAELLVVKKGNRPDSAGKTWFRRLV